MKQFRAVSGDMMLRVPCYASGNPKPTITWTTNGLDIATGSEWYDMAEDGSLIIKNVDTRSAGSYVCWARNKFGADNEAFDVIVESYAAANFVNTTFTVEEGKLAVVPCSVPHQRTDRVLWFKDSKKVAEGELQLPYVTSRDAGVYTCRVSSFTGAKTGATMVITGSKPQFIYYNEKESVIEYKEGGTQVMDCRTYEVTKPEVKWLHNGASMDYDELAYSLQMYSPSVKGRYTCIVSNEFGSAQQEFVVKTFGCALDIKNDFKGNAPLMLTPKLEIPKFEVVDGHVNIPRDEYIVFYCHTRFTILRKREIMVTCVNNKIFDYEGTKLSYSDFKCNHKVDTIPFNTNHRCNHGNSELINIGFNARKKFVPVYQLCWDGIKTVYSKLNIQPTLANILPNYGFNNGPHSNLNAIFNCNNQNNKITEILGLEFHTSDSCCFEKRQLVSPKDVAPGLSQTATYISLNVVPHWSTCNSQYTGVLHILAAASALYCIVECTSVLDILAAASAHPVATIALYVESNTDQNESKHDISAMVLSRVQSTDEENELFYDDISEALELKKCRYQILLGDFNAKVGSDRKGSDELCGTEWAFCNEYILKKKSKRRWTWTSPNGSVKNEIDYILCNRKDIITDVSVLNKFNSGSDHRMVRATVEINFKKERSKIVSKPLAKQHITGFPDEEFEKKLIQVECEGDNRNITNLDERYDHFTESISNLAKIHFPKTISSRQKKLTDKTGKLLEKRRNIPADSLNTREHRALNRTITKAIRVITNRLAQRTDHFQPREQVGFRKAFVDYEKAFDSVEHWSVWNSLKRCQIDQRYIEVLKSLNNSATMKIRLNDSTTNPIPILKGVQQGDVISPKLFTNVSEDIFKTVHCDSLGINIEGEYLNHLRFADDIMIIADNRHHLEQMLQYLHNSSIQVGLQMNMEKTKIMATADLTANPFLIGNTPLEQVNEYVYLGQVMTVGR
ncbi:hypothetical protein MSG28_009238 [Choristoneura fumiferana]|uniref:Uncharacterized protein n=1 Tax=Choristoneura fumiferana TaxID=7141 RepID=A0ACC0KXY6_CHOFU|nr:hypothetical protein MSG28_009238 [Choristoneura fumiferana]